MERKRMIVVLILSAAVGMGCGIGPGLTGLATGATPTPNSSESQPTQPAQATMPPAATGAPSANPPASGGQFTYPVNVVHTDASGDCLSNADGSPVACHPAGLDIDSVTVSRPDAAGAVTINLELAGNGVKDLKGLTVWGLTYAFDLDRNIATGLHDVYPTQHHIGPDLTIIYGQVNGSVKQIVQRYTSTGNAVDADSSLATWSFPDDKHIQVQVSASLIPAEQFYVVGDIVTSDMYDHFVENGYLAFPDGQAVSQKPGAPSATLAPAITPPPQASTSGAGVIARAVTAQGVKGLDAPVGITNQFPNGQGKIHAVVETSNAPKGTKIKATWIAVDVGSVAAPNFKLGEYEGDVVGTEYEDFSFTPNGGHMAPGKYRVELYLNGTLDRSLDFSVAGPGTRVPAPASPTVAVGNCPSRPSPNFQPSGVIAKLTTTTGTKGAGLDPVNTTTAFASNAELHVVVATQDAPANTKVTAIWFATDVGDAAPCNGTLTEPTDLTTEGSSNLDFSVNPASKWPIGKYRVEIYVNDVLDSEADFTVK